jgi:hypothetical protein
MNPTDSSTNFDVALILALPIEEVIYTPRNIPQPTGASEVATLTENERRLFHFMVACRLSEYAFRHQALSCDVQYQGLLYTGNDGEELRELKQKVDKNDISMSLFERKTKTAEELFWSAVKIRINSVVPVGHKKNYRVSVYGDNKIGLQPVNPHEEVIDALFRGCYVTSLTED